MQINTTAADLKSALALCARVTERRNTIPILSYALLTAEKRSATLAATNLDIDVKLSLPCSVVKTGALAIPGMQLGKLVAAMPRDTPIGLAGDDGGGLAVTAPFGCYSLPGLPAGDFPDPIRLPDPENIEVDGARFRAALKMALRSVSTEKTRYYLNGVCLDCSKDDEPLAVASNGHHLTALPSGLGRFAEDGTRIVSTKAAKLLAGVPLQALRVADLSLEAGFAGGTIRAKLIDGTFPAWRQVVPKECTSAFKVSPAELLPRIARLRALSGRKFPSISLGFAPDGRGVVGAFGPEQSGHEYFSFTPVSLSEPVIFSVNAEYVATLLKGHTEIEVGFNGPVDPITLHAPGVRQLLMPMRGGEDKIGPLLKAQEVRAAA